LILESYRYLSTKTVEDIFISCIDPIDKEFDIQHFELLIEEQLNGCINC
jgi:hypothetical protein